MNDCLRLAASFRLCYSLGVNIVGSTEKIKDRLNHLMTLHIYQDKLDSLDFVSVANEFVSLNEHRRTFFGTFAQP